MAVYVLALTLATAGSLLALRAILLNRMDERIQANLQQEVAELRRLARGTDPETGEPFEGKVRRIFDVFLQRNVPSVNETMLTIVDGEPYLRPSRDPHYRIDSDTELVALWTAADRPLSGRADTPAGGFDYLAVPMVVDGDKRGVFVVGEFREYEKAEVDDAVKIAALVSLVTLAIGSLLAWRLAEKILGRVRAVSDTAHAISGTDLDRRIDIVGNDEIAQLSQTFNEMLDRLQFAFDQQRAFVDDAGHELRTPITIIRGHLEVLGNDPLEQEETKALVLDELQRMGRIVDDLLTLAKAEKPDFLHPEPVDVSALSDDLYDKARAL
ncbi:MAG: histidine kinase dimerization/phospho-acceptor domain-containing protein [Actinomycetota bacterium]